MHRSRANGHSGDTSDVQVGCFSSHEDVHLLSSISAVVFCSLESITVVVQDHFFHIPQVDFLAFVSHTAGVVRARFQPPPPPPEPVHSTHLAVAVPITYTEHDVRFTERQPSFFIRSLFYPVGSSTFLLCVRVKPAILFPCSHREADGLQCSFGDRSLVCDSLRFLVASICSLTEQASKESPSPPYPPHPRLQPLLARVALSPSLTRTHELQVLELVGYVLPSAITDLSLAMARACTAFSPSRPPDLGRGQEIAEAEHEDIVSGNAEELSEGGGVADGKGGCKNLFRAVLSVDPGTAHLNAAFRALDASMAAAVTATRGGSSDASVQVTPVRGSYCSETRARVFSRRAERDGGGSGGIVFDVCSTEPSVGVLL